MNSFFKFIMLTCSLSISLLISGCGDEPATFPPPPKPVENPADVSWGFDSEGIRYAIEAVDDLNFQKDRPLAVTVCIFQLKDISVFNTMTATPEGLHSMINGKNPEGTLISRTFSIQPGTLKEFKSERMDGARYVGVIAGYAHKRLESCSASLPLAVHVDKKGMFRTPYYSAGKTDIIIHLGSESVTLKGVERVQ